MTRCDGAHAMWATGRTWAREHDVVARGQRPSSDGRNGQSRQRQRPARQEEGPIPVLAKAVHGVEVAVQRDRVTPTTRATFQAVALLVRELREQAKSEPMSEAQRNVQMRRIEGIATVLARTAARNSSLLSLLTDEAALVGGTRLVMDELRVAAGMKPPETPIEAAPQTEQSAPARRVVPQSVISRQLANPFLAPDFSAPAPPRGR